MSLRRDALLAVDGFDSDFGRRGPNEGACEETELCIRIHETFPDGHMLFDPEAIVDHRVTSSRMTLKHFRTRCFSEGRSKAQLARKAGVAKALEAERAYARSTLPIGAFRYLVGGQVGRALALAAGFTWTVVGFVLGSIESAVRRVR